METWTRFSKTVSIGEVLSVKFVGWDKKTLHHYWNLLLSLFYKSGYKTISFYSNL